MSDNCLEKLKKAEESLRKSEERYRELVNALPEIVFEADLTGKITLFADQAFSLTGYSREEFEEGLNMLHFVVPEQRGKALENMKKTFSGNPKGPNEYTLLRKDGTTFPALVRTLPIISENKVIGLRGTALDITELKRIMQSSRDSEEKFHGIANSVRDAIVLVNDEAKVTYWNPAAEKIFGYASTEVIGKDIHLLVTPKIVYEQKECVDKEVKLFAETGEGKITAGNFELVAQRKDGSEFIAELSISPVKLGGKWNAVGVVKDITERKKRESELNNEKSKLEAITQSIGAGFVIISKDYHVLWANRFIKEYKGDVVGKLCYATLNDLDHVCPDCGVKKVFENNADYDAHEYTSIDIRGNPYWVELIATPIKDEKGNLTSAVEVCVDITEKKRMQSKLAEYSHKLENLVEERTRQLKEAELQLVRKERLAAIGELAGMIGHDLRNPLTGIKNAAYILEKKGASITEAQAKELIETIDKCVKYSNKIISDLLDYSRELHLEPQESSPRVLLCESLSMVEVPDNIKIVNNVLHKQTLKADSDKIKRVFVNLIKNAIDAMPNGGKLTIDSKVNDNNIEISFSDTGSGIPDDIMPKLFFPLFTTKSQGMGFGLAICKRIVEAHGGTITVKTTQDKGTTFTVTLPIEPQCEIREKIWINTPEPVASFITKT